MHDLKLITRCKKGDRKAQNQLFHQYAPVLMSICLRYMKSYDKAEDMLSQAFYKILTKIDSYTGVGNFEGWMKRIVVNECLMELRKRNNLTMTIPVEDAASEIRIEFVDNLEYEEILALLDELPTGYRTVFNLYVMEGYKHKEIAAQLGISINTSKSQLILARRKLQGLIKKKLRIKIA